MQGGNSTTFDSSLLAYLISPEELAKRLGVSKAWINARAGNSGPGKLRYYRIGEHIWFSIPEIEDYLEIYGKD